MSPAHHLDIFQCCSHHLATLYGVSYTDYFNHFLSLVNPLHPDLDPLMYCINMFSSVFNLNDLALTTLNLLDLSIARTRSLVKYVGSKNHILKQLPLDEFQDTPENA